MKQIEKASFETTIRHIRALYKRYQHGEINSTTFASRSAKLVWELRNKQIIATIYETGERVEKEIRSYQAQFGMDLQFETRIYYQRGQKAEVRISQRGTIYGGIFIGPKHHWDQICVQPTDKDYGWFGPNMYTKRMAKRWRNVDEFDFPAYLQQLREHIDACIARDKEGRRRIESGEAARDKMPF